jgi:hypothetical protein
MLRCAWPGQPAAAGRSGCQRSDVPGCRSPFRGDGGSPWSSLASQAALAAYDAHGRLPGGSYEEMAEQACRAYYLTAVEKSGEPAGTWVGDGAAELGFRDGDVVRREDFERLFGQFLDPAIRRDGRTWRQPGSCPSRSGCTGRMRRAARCRMRRTISPAPRIAPGHRAAAPRPPSPAASQAHQRVLTKRRGQIRGQLTGPQQVERHRQRRDRIPRRPGARHQRRQHPERLQEQPAAGSAR